jgi:hypothetical protein
LLVNGCVVLRILRRALTCSAACDWLVELRFVKVNAEGREIKAGRVYGRRSEGDSFWSVPKCVVAVWSGLV